MRQAVIRRFCRAYKADANIVSEGSHRVPATKEPAPLFSSSDTIVPQPWTYLIDEVNEFLGLFTPKTPRGSDPGR